MFNLEAPNGNFPYLVSVFNAQTLDHARSTTRPARRSTRTPNGTGPWKLTSFDAATGASFERNPDWWGGQTPLDGQEVQFFDDLGTMVTAMQGGAVDALVQFSVLGGDALLNSPDFTVLEIESTTHRQIWMRCDTGQFVDKAVRQALAYTFDREQMVSTLFQGRAEVANDHVFAPFMPFFDDVAAAAADQGHRRWPGSCSPTPALEGGLQAVLHAADLQEIPELAQLIQAGAAEAGINLEIADREPATRSTAPSGARPSRPTRRARAPPSWASSTTATARRPTCS